MRTRVRKRLGPEFSEAARQLWLKIAELGWSLEELRKALKVGKGVVSRWLYGDCLPSIMHVVAIQKLFGIDPKLWVDAPAEKFNPLRSGPPAEHRATGTDG